MKNYISFNRFIVFILLMGCNSLAAQKEDNIWLLGKRIVENKPDTGVNKEFGLTVINFTNQQLVRELSEIGFSSTNTAICDKIGNLSFYTNGTKILTKEFKIMENGDSINAGYLQFGWDTTIKRDGYRSPQGSIILPFPNNDSLYYVFHILIDTSLTLVLYDKQLLVSLVNVKSNNGLGKVIYKDSILIQDTLGGTINAVKHANGKGWWIYVPEVNNNCKYVFTLTEKGLSTSIKKECIGNVIKIGDAPASCFSPDGKKYILFEGYNGLSIFDVNRCTGKLSNPKYCPIKELVDSSWKAFGVSISPNSRFTYATLTKYIYQYDLWATDIASSKIKVAEYDGFYDDITPLRTYFSDAQLTPSDKIYISTGNTTRYLHIIDKPNEKGLACNVIQHGLKLPTWNRSIPYFPHYRMGADSSSCTSGIEDEVKMDIQVYPNPASDYVLVSGQLSVVSKLELFNILGQKTDTKVELIDNHFKIDTRALSEGIYVLQLRDKTNNVLKTEKVVIAK